MIVDVVLDVPIAHPFSYRLPDGWVVAPGQRVLAPLRGAARPAVVLAVREGDPSDLKPLLGVLDPAPVLGACQLELAGWIARNSLTSLGSTCLALMPPPLPASGAGAARGARRPGRAAVTPVAPPPAAVTGPTGGASGLPELSAAAPPELLVGAGREARLLERVSQAGHRALVLVPDVEAAARWSQRLGRLAPVARLDSGVPDAERARGWQALATGAATLAVGTRSALLAPLAPDGVLAMVDEHEAAHKPPGPPRLHGRDVILERAARGQGHAVFTSATPSVELWWRATSGLARLEPAPVAPWPAVIVADTRGIGRREALTPLLARTIRETLGARRRVVLVVTRRASALGCDECGLITRCPRCAIALAYSPAARTLTCRLCSASHPLPETCPGCQGRRLAPFGWSAERVEHAVRRRFARARIARVDLESPRGRRAEERRAAAQAAEVVVGTRSVLKLFGPGSLGLAAFISPDQLLGLPDFRGAERAFALFWAAAERVRPDGHLLIQTQNPDHYAVAAVSRQDREAFYKPELKFRAELGYPPFRRLALVTVEGAEPAASGRLAAQVATALGAAPGLTVYPPRADRRQRAWRIVVKGGDDLPRLLEDAFGDPEIGALRSRGIMTVEVDPVEWPS